MMHRFCLRVYYEDTDFGGLVYYANYLKFIERARSEWVRSLGIDQSKLKFEQGVVFAVSHLEAEYVMPAQFDDLLEVRTQLESLTAARLILSQKVCRDEELLFTALVTLVAISASGKPVRLPAEIRLLRA